MAAFKIREAQTGDFQKLDIQPAQQPSYNIIAQALQNDPYLKIRGWAGERGDGSVVAMGGVNELVPWRGVAWMLISGDISRPHMLQLHRFVSERLDEAVERFGRVESYVDRNFHNGHRWMRMLGFRLEAPMARRLWPDGRDGSIYAKVKSDA